MDSKQNEHDFSKEALSENAPLNKYKGIFDGLIKDPSNEVSDEDLVKLGTIWDKVENFITEDLKDGFQMKDLYSLIIAVMNALELFFPGVTGVQLKKYAIYLVKRLIAELDKRNVIPSEVAIMLNFIPIGTIIDLISNIGKKSALVNKVSNSNRKALLDSDWVRRNWVGRQEHKEDL